MRREAERFSLTRLPLVLLKIARWGLALSATVIWGLVGADWPYVRHVRSRIAWRPDPRRRGSDLVWLPFGSLAVLCVGVAMAVPSAGAHALLWLAGGSALFVGLIAAFRPRPFMPVWLCAEAKLSAAGLPPALPPPPEGTTPRICSTRDHAVVWALVGVVALAGVALQFSGSFAAVMLASGAITSGTLERSNRSRR